MSNETSLSAESRTQFGKGAARRLRRESKVPAVLYGHGTDPIHISLPGHDTLMALRHGGANALLSIELDGKSQLALPKQVQSDPVKGHLEHLDLIIVRKGEKVTVEVPIVLVGDAASDALVTTEHNTVSVEAEATHIPESIEVSIEKAEVGTQIHAKDLMLPTGAALQTDEETLIVNITAAPTAAQVDAELAEAEAGVGIEHEAPASVDEAPAETAAE